MNTILTHALLVLGAVALLAGCANEPASMEDQLSGTWRLTGIFDQDQDVTAEHNPSNNRWINLKPDGSFESDGDPYGRNTGKWSWDATEKLLHLDSDAGEEDDSYWSVEIKEKEMSWRGAKFEFSKRFRLTYARGVPA